MKRKNIGQAIKFCTVGFFNTLIDYGVFYLLIAFLNADKSIAQIFATAVAMCGSYIGNKKWTFGEKGKTTKKHIVRFLVTNLISMCSTIVFMTLFHDVIHIHLWANGILNALKIPYILDGNIGVLFCKVLASCISLIINFFGNKFWVFSIHEEKQR